MKKIIYSLLIVVFTSSCAFHQGMMTGSASISNSNFSIVDFVTGTATTSQIFGIGGLNSDALVLEAKRNLYINHPLKRGQALANLTVDFKREFYFIIFKTRATITAEVVDFNIAPTDQTFEQINKKIRKSTPTNLENFNIGETILITLNDNRKDASIIGFKNETVTVQYNSNNNLLKSKKLNLNKIFKTKASPKNIELYGYQINQIVQFETDNFIKTEGKIIGLNNTHAWIEYQKINKLDWISVRLSSLEKN
jgi:hypothetical protein